MGSVLREPWPTLYHTRWGLCVLWGGQQPRREHRAEEGFREIAAPGLSRKAKEERARKETQGAHGAWPDTGVSRGGRARGEACAPSRHRGVSHWPGGLGKAQVSTPRPNFWMLCRCSSPGPRLAEPLLRSQREKPAVQAALVCAVLPSVQLAVLTPALQTTLPAN